MKTHAILPFSTLQLRVHSDGSGGFVSSAGESGCMPLSGYFHGEDFTVRRPAPDIFHTRNTGWVDFSGTTSIRVLYL